MFFLHFVVNIGSWWCLRVCTVLQMPSSKTQSADDIIKKCHDVGEKLMQVGGGVDSSKNAAIGNSAGRPVHYLHELPHAAEERYAELFKRLDRNGKHSHLVRQL